MYNDLKTHEETNSLDVLKGDNDVNLEAVLPNDAPETSSIDKNYLKCHLCPTWFVIAKDLKKHVAGKY